MLSPEIGIDPQIPSENPNKSLHSPDRGPETHAREAVPQHRDAVGQNMVSHTCIPNIFRRISLEITCPRDLADADTYLDEVSPAFCCKPRYANTFQNKATNNSSTNISSDQANHDIIEQPIKMKAKLGRSGVADLFIRMRRFEDAALSANHEVMSSGEPQTHPGLAEACENQEQAAVELTDNFVCAGGVNVTTLLRATRTSLLEHVEPLGANALLDEQCVLNSLCLMFHLLNANRLFVHLDGNAKLPNRSQRTKAHIKFG